MHGVAVQSGDQRGGMAFPEMGGQVKRATGEIVLTKTKLILVCRDGDARQAYLKEAERAGAEVETVSSYRELFQRTLDTAYQGIMIDLVTGLKASREEKEVVKDVLDSFPVVQLKWEREAGAVRAVSLGKALSNASVKDFIESDCRPFKPRAIRLHPRKDLHFNVLLSMDEAMAEKDLERTVTVNVSKGGCLLFTGRDWTNVRDAWFVIQELKDKTPISGEIRWFLPWGKKMGIPGIGVRFRRMTAEQQKELAEKYLPD